MQSWLNWSFRTFAWTFDGSMHQKLREIFYRLWKLKSATDAETDTTDGEIYFRISAAQRASSLSQKDPGSQRDPVKFLWDWATWRSTKPLIRIILCAYALASLRALHAVRLRGEMMKPQPSQIRVHESRCRVYVAVLAFVQNVPNLPYLRVEVL